MKLATPALWATFFCTNSSSRSAWIFNADLLGPIFAQVLPASATASNQAVTRPEFALAAQDQVKALQ